MDGSLVRVIESTETCQTQKTPQPSSCSLAVVPGIAYWLVSTGRYGAAGAGAAAAGAAGAAVGAGGTGVLSGVGEAAACMVARTRASTVCSTLGVGAAVLCAVGAAA